MDAIIFLAPISGFDDELTDDPSVSRLDDCLTSWRTICSSRLLAKSALILLLNKCDLLEAKIMRGVYFKQYVPSFGERENETKVIIRCE